MSFHRKQRDHKKVNNYVAKNDFNRGGYHGKSNKQQRGNLKSDLSQIDLDNKEIWDELEEAYDHE